MTGWQGTPGPWTADEMVVKAAGTVAMAWPDPSVDSNESLRRMRANAQGIAAVPQLVEALLPFAQGTVGDHDPLAAAKARLTACKALEAAGVKL